ncbi:MAG: hypothetical protein LBS64_00480 [Spirochaetaceae bacterium]|jgi:tetratricopeptide (TPR) repeat protein|nr:hypothetical protein [Spirochaetaceae bacterium]
MKKIRLFLLTLTCAWSLVSCTANGSRPEDLLAGKEALFQGQDEESLALFAALEKRNPRDTESRLWKIRALTLLGQHGLASRAVEEELSFNPGDWRFYFQGALIAARTGDTESRIAMLKAAETCLEESVRVYLELAKIWSGLGMNDRALEMIHRGQAAAPKGAFAEPLASLAEIIREKEGGDAQ